MKWTDVISALAALLGVVVATGAGVVARRAYIAQSSQLKELKQDKEQQSAAGLAVWLGPVDMDGGPRTLNYHNAGPLPVYGVTLHIRIGNEEMEFLRIGDLGPTPEPQVLEAATQQIHQAVLDRVAEWTRAVSESVAQDEADLRHVLADIEYAVRVVATVFKDANGTEWTRETSGALRPGGLAAYRSPSSFRDFP